MSAEDTVGIQTRAMTEAQCMEGEVQRAMDNNQEGGQSSPKYRRDYMRPSNESCSGDPQKQRLNYQRVCPMARRNQPRLVCTRLCKYTSKILNQRQSQVCHPERQDTIHLPSTQQILPHINLRVRSCNRMNLHIPHSIRGHRHPMLTGRI